MTVSMCTKYYVIMTHFLDTVTLNVFHWKYIGYRVNIGTFCLKLNYNAMAVPQEPL